MSKSLYTKIIMAVLLCFLLLPSAFGEVSIRILPAGSKIIEERDGYLVGFMPIRDLDKTVVNCPPAEDTLLTDDEDCLLIMQACRKLGQAPGRENPGDVFFTTRISF